MNFILDHKQLHYSLENMAKKANREAGPVSGGESASGGAPAVSRHKAKPPQGGTDDADPIMKRTCTCCKKHLHKSKYSKTQWSKNNAAKCKRCIIARQISGDTPTGGRQEQLIPLESTEAYQVRQNNSISPKDRLIKFCELGCIIDLGLMNGGILPEKLQVPGCTMPIPYTNTPYKYWGLPRDDSDFVGGSRNFKKRVRKRSHYFYELDLDWMVENVDLVLPYFDEVAIEGERVYNGFVFEDVSWAEQVEKLKAAISCKGRNNGDLVEELETMGMNDSWQPPTEAEAYRVRSSNTITPKDRLLEYCELASISYDGYIKPERVVPSLPPRRTTNRYWGISPQGGRSVEDISTWDFFMDAEMIWLRSNADLVQPHFDEIARMGYATSVYAVEYVIQHGEICHSTSSSLMLFQVSDELQNLQCLCERCHSSI